MSDVTEEFGKEITAIEMRMDARVGRIEDRVENIENDMKSVKADMTEMRKDMIEVRKDIAGVHSAIAGINEKMNINDIRLNVEKAHTGIYKWIASGSVSVAALGIAVVTALRPAGTVPPTTVTASTSSTAGQVARPFTEELKTP